MNKNSIPIIVLAYNRVDSLKRLLLSLNSSNCPQNTDLYISIDYSDNPDVYTLCHQFNWKYGEKHIIKHKKNLGIKEHVFSTGKIINKYDGAIILEDDLLVSPEFYNYTQVAFEFYLSSKIWDRVCGISLYSHVYNETSLLPFIPIDDGYDNYYLQLPSSWGQFWSKKSWNSFQKWHVKTDFSEANENWNKIPKNIRRWDHNSWKKEYTLYMIENDLMFLYPRNSLTTNFSEIGVHARKRHNNYQTNMLLKSKKWIFSNPSTSIACYDSFCEIIPETVVSWVGNQYSDLTIDIYGSKDINNIKSEYLLSIKNSNNLITSYSIELLPIEANLAFAKKGKQLKLAKTTSFNNTNHIKSHISILSTLYKLPEKYFIFRSIAKLFNII